jgi:hypothetical protein
MTDEETSQVRRLSICRQLSDVLKSKRKSYSSSSSDHVTPTTSHSASSTFTFVWNCALTEMNSPSKEDLNILSSRKNILSNDPKNITGSMAAACLVKQKSISCDDIPYLSSNENDKTISTTPTDDTSIFNGLFFSPFLFKN